LYLWRDAFPPAALTSCLKWISYISSYGRWLWIKNKDGHGMKLLPFTLRHHALATQTQTGRSVRLRSLLRILTLFSLPRRCCTGCACRRKVSSIECRQSLEPWYSCANNNIAYMWLDEGFRLVIGFTVPYHEHVHSHDFVSLLLVARTILLYNRIHTECWKTCANRGPVSTLENFQWCGESCFVGAAILRGRCLQLIPRRGKHKSLLISAVPYAGLV
jgi:hypothetical protein